MSISIDLSGKVALVIGGSRGIGRATVVALANAGAHVVAAARSQEALRETAEEAAAIGGSAVVRSVDLARPESAAALVDEVRAAEGRLDILVNSAGISPAYGSAEHLTQRDLEAMIAVNQTAAFVACQAAARIMIADAAGGSIVNVASVGGLVGLSRLAGYSMTKGALVQMTKVMALDWARHAIRVNAVCPAFVVTDMTAGLRASTRLHEELVGMTPVGRLAEPEEVAGPVVFLCSELATYVTGTCLTIDGGWTAR